MCRAGTIMTRTSWRKCTANGTRTSSTFTGWWPRVTRANRTCRRRDNRSPRSLQPDHRRLPRQRRRRRRTSSRPRRHPTLAVCTVNITRPRPVRRLPYSRPRRHTGPRPRLVCPLCTNIRPPGRDIHRNANQICVLCALLLLLFSLFLYIKFGFFVFL